ncbi:MAG: hypothetical protein JST33_11550 [Actinobacteria bacterium]|nr:hypothetical protein [Actinomycetota bacterium]
MTDATDPRDAAWAQLHDPATSASRLAEIAQAHPDFASAIAAHPHCYPELRSWAAGLSPGTSAAGVPIVTPAAAAAPAPAAAAAPAPAAAAAPAPAAAAAPGAAATLDAEPRGSVAAPIRTSTSSSSPGPRSGMLSALRTRKGITITAIVIAAVLLIGGGGAWAAVALSSTAGPSAAAPAPAPTTDAPSSPQPMPLVCPTMKPAAQGFGSGPTSTPAPDVVLSSDSTRADLTAELTPMLSADSPIVKAIGAMPAGTTRAADALRGALFTTPKAADVLRDLDARLARECGGHLIADLDGIIAQVPTMKGDRITHTEDLFGACGGSSARSLGWSGSTQVFACDSTVISLDYTKRTLSSYTIPTSGGAKDESTTSPVLTGDHVVWTRTTEKPQPGLVQPLFTGTLYSVDLSLASPHSVAVFTDLTAPATPEFFVMAAGAGFAVVGGRSGGAQLYTNSATAPSAIYDVRTPDPKKVELSLPPYQSGMYTLDVSDLNAGLLPVWKTEGDRGVYLDVAAKTLVSGATFDARLDDGGCQRLIVAGDAGGKEQYDSSSNLKSTPYVVAAPSATGSLGGKVAVSTSDGNSILGFEADGVLVTTRDGIAVTGFDGSPRWSIPSSVASLKGRYLDRLVMLNKSEKFVIVDESTGKEMTDPNDEVAVFLKTISEKDAAENSDPHFALVQDGDHVLLSGFIKDEGTVALLLTRSTVCPAKTVPGATTPLAQLFPVTP